MLWAVAYTQDLNPATSLTVLTTLFTAVVVFAILFLVHRGKLPAMPGLIAAFITPFLAWAGIALLAPESGLPLFSGTTKRVVATVIAAMPVLVLFYLLVGRRWLASGAGAAGSVMMPAVGSESPRPLSLTVTVMVVPPLLIWAPVSPLNANCCHALLTSL